MKTATITCLVVALLGAGLVATAALRRQNEVRRSRVAGLRLQPSRAGVAGEGARPAGAEAGPAPADGPGGEAGRLRAEIAALERRAEAWQAAHPGMTDPAAANRDPEQGLTRLEYLRNVGQATPAAAFQTLVWAALKGDEAVLAKTVGLDESGRAEVEAMRAGLPEAEQARYPTPESLFALFLAKALVQVSAIHIADTKLADPQNATVTVRGLLGNEQSLPMRRGPAGWQLWEGPAQIEWLRRELAGKK